MLKYKLTEDSKIVDGHKVYRIKYLSDQRLGGWLESYRNLSQEGTCGVFDDAVVYGKARVSQDARVLGSAQVSGNSTVYDQATVHGSAKIRGWCAVYGTADISGQAQITDSRIRAAVRVVGGSITGSTIKGNTEVLNSRLISSNVYFGSSILMDCVLDGATLRGTCEVKTARIRGTLSCSRVIGLTVPSGAVIRNGDLRQNTDLFVVTNVGSEDGTLTIYHGRGRKLATRGCFTGTLKEFLTAVAKKHRPTSTLYRQYEQLIKIGAQRIQRTRGA